MAGQSENIAHKDLVSSQPTTLHRHNSPGLFYGVIKGATQDRRYVAGGCSTIALGTAGVGTAANVLRVFPFIPPMDMTADRLCAWISTLLAGNNLKLGIYGDNGSLYPGVLLVDSGPLDTSATGIKDVTISVAMIGGQLYWIGYVLNTVTTLALRKLAIGAYIPIMGVSIAATPVWGIGWTVAHTFANALPNPYTAGGTILAAVAEIMVAVRAA